MMVTDLPWKRGKRVKLKLGEQPFVTGTDSLHSNKEFASTRGC
jgi:hypothetical protein